MAEVLKMENIIKCDARGPCRVCGEDGRACARCRLDFYCGKEHQRQDWGRHKAGCGAVELRRSAELGRHVVLTKDVRAGTVLLRDRPLVSVVPPWKPQFMPWCVGCMVDRDNMEFSGAFYMDCPRCGWPLCSRKCGDSPAHLPECREFQRAGFKLTPEVVVSTDFLWIALAALRTYLASKTHPRLMDLQSSHANPLDGTWTAPWSEVVLGVNDGNCWRALDTPAARREKWRLAAAWLRSEARLHWLPEDGLVRAAGVNDINGLHLSPLNMNPDIRRWLAVHLFPGFSMLEHCCAPTGMLVSYNDDPSLEHVVLAARDLAAGEHLSLDYLEAPFQDAAVRRTMLRRGWSFVCRCDRCEDPTTLGQFLGCPCCPECAGRGEQQLMVPECPDGSRDADFRCRGCGQTASVPRLEEEHDTLLQLKSVCASAKKHVSSLQETLWPRGPLHDKHSLVLNTEFSSIICQLKGAVLDNEPFTESELEKHLARVKKLLDVLDVVKPGLSNHRWALLFNAYTMCETSINQLDLDRPGIRPKRLRVIKKRMLKMLEFAEQTAVYHLPEGRLWFKDRFEAPLESALARPILASLKI